MTMTAAGPNATSTPGYSETLPCEAASARRARLFVAMVLHTWGLDNLAEAGSLIASELVANVVNHTRCRFVRVAVQRLADDLVRVAVEDRSLGVPKVDCCGENSENGRGLVLVEALSRDWGYDLHQSGKVVWAELSLSAVESKR